MIGIVIPFREDYSGKRASQLQQFLERVIPALSRNLQNKFVIVIVEQSNDNRLFNRGALLNAGVHLCFEKKVSTIVLHDVDLIPSDELLYAYGSKCQHAACHIGYNWPGRYSAFKEPERCATDSYLPHTGSFYGGVMACSVAQYMAANGYPNDFFGWGGEDEEFAARLKHAQVPLVVPTRGLLSDTESLTVDNKLTLLKKHGLKCERKFELKIDHEKHRTINGTSGRGFHECQFTTEKTLVDTDIVTHVVVRLH